MGAKLEKVKSTAKYATWVLLGILYFPIYFTFWVLRFVSRFILAISYYGTFDHYMGYKIFKTLFNKKYDF